MYEYLLLKIEYGDYPINPIKKRNLLLLRYEFRNGSSSAWFARGSR